MKKFAFLTAVSALTIAPLGALADNMSDAQYDASAVHKDQTVIDNGENGLATNRAAKAEDKANGNFAKQAVDSTKIGIDQTVVGEKKRERTSDTKALHNDIDK